MERPTIECLRCGQTRAFDPSPGRCDGSGVCPRCQYVGWAYSSDLTERTRRLVRDVPPEQRLRLRPI